MQYFDHALLGATLTLATGTPRRHGWAIVVMGAAAATLPDWDAIPYPKGTAEYSSVHRVWGHNLLVAPLLSGLVGGLGYLCWISARKPRDDLGRKEGFSAQALAVWVVVGVMASLSHLLADLFYCGELRSPDWPVRLLWPFSQAGWALPRVVWADQGVTWILGATLIAAYLRPALAQLFAVTALLVVISYVAVGGAFP